jgi:hypothetical protein
MNANIRNFPEVLQSIIQQGFLEREFQYALEASGMRRMP